MSGFSSSQHSRPLQSLHRVAAAILVLLLGWVLHTVAVVAVPIVFALFVAVVLAPIDQKLTKSLPHRLSWLGRIAVFVLLLAGLGIFFAGLVYSARLVIAELPSIAETLDQFLPEDMAVMESLEQAMGEDARNTEAQAATPPPERASDGAALPLPPELRQTFNQTGSTIAGWLVDTTSGLAQRVLGAVGTFVAATVIVIFMVMLGLSESSTWHRKLGALWPESSVNWKSAIETISRKLRGFLLVRAAMGLLTAALYTAFLWAFDIGLLTVWAVLTFLLSFVPNLGSIISGILPTLYALVTQDLQTALIVGLGLFVIEQIIGNWIDPRVQGRQIAISPLVVLVSILVWSWIWGAAGALLAVPMMVALMVTCAYIEPLRPVALLLSDQSDPEALDRALESGPDRQPSPARYR